MSKYKVTHLGNTEDVKCSLALLFEHTHTPAKAAENIAWLKDAMQEERENKNRTSVLAMIKSYTRRLEKKFRV